MNNPAHTKFLQSKLKLKFFNKKKYICFKRQTIIKFSILSNIYHFFAKCNKEKTRKFSSKNKINNSKNIFRLFFFFIFFILCFFLYGKYCMENYKTEKCMKNDLFNDKKIFFIK